MAVSASLTPPPAPLWQRAWPHVLAVLFFVVLAVAYFAPIVFDHQTLAQHDITQFQGGAHETQQWAAEHGHEPLWTNSMFSGMPTYLISVHFPGDLFVFVQKAVALGLPGVVSNLFVALLCGYVLLVALGVRPLVAVAGAVALGFSSYNLAILAAGHNTKSWALAYAPLVLGGLLLAFRQNKWLGAALFTLGLTMNVRANHPQITYYLGLLVAIYGLIELVAAIRAGRLPDFLSRVALLGVGALLAVGVSFGRLYTTYEYSKYSNRSPSELKVLPPQPGQTSPSARQQDRDYAFAYSYGVGETMTLLVPNFYGGSSAMPLGKDSHLAAAGLPEEYLGSMPTYWGDQAYVAGPVYVGVTVCFLFVLGLFVVDKRTRYWLLAGTLLSFVLAWGKNFETINNLIFDYLPGYRSFRAVSMGLVIAQLAMPLLAALALSRILRPRPVAVPPGAGPAAEPVHPALAKAARAAAGTPAVVVESADNQLRTRQLLYAGAITAGFLLLSWIASLSFDYASPQDAGLSQSGFTPQLMTALRADRADLLHNDIWRGLLFVGLTLAALFFYLKGKIDARLAALAVAALVLLDLWTVDKRYLGEKNFQNETIVESFQPSPADQQILQDKDLSYRVLNLGNPFNEARTSYFHKSIGGYHGAKLRRYQDLIERQISQNNTGVLNMLNTRYVIVPPQKQGEAEQVQRNPGALGNAWFVRELKAVASPDEEMNALSSLNTKQVAVVDTHKFPDVKPATYADSSATIALTSYAPDALTYRYSAAQPATVVFSEIYYADGWQAFLDGKPVPYFRADWVLRAMQVPAGSHEIKFVFEPKEYKIGNTVSLLSSIGVLLAVVAAGIFGFRQRRINEDNDTAKAA
ncbi:YfhO family protein [Hymenobacter baengnokdamensis]|uniref:YfhO family protein n=1 Tax=Hymenobacter baengnokdamensis TaxID=2615203 RepID=UPI00124747F0|nr:YfhO family protein [Hymenobacter baengnokdamensis]